MKKGDKVKFSEILDAGKVVVFRTARSMFPAESLLIPYVSGALIGASPVIRCQDGCFCGRYYEGKQSYHKSSISGSIGRDTECEVIDCGPCDACNGYGSVATTNNDQDGNAIEIRCPVCG